MVKNKGLKKIPGCSWLEVDGLVHRFRVADRSHQRSIEIYSILQNVKLEIDDILNTSLQNSWCIEDIQHY